MHTDTDPHGVTARYQARGDTAVTEALKLNGPLAPVPYFPSATVPTATQVRDQINDRTLAARIASLNAMHLPTATRSARSATR